MSKTWTSLKPFDNNNTKRVFTERFKADNLYLNYSIISQGMNNFTVVRYEITRA